MVIDIAFEICNKNRNEKGNERSHYNKIKTVKMIMKMVTHVAYENGDKSRNENGNGIGNSERRLW